MKNILITGAAGKLGATLLKCLPNAFASTRANFDITNAAMMDEFFEQNASVDTVVHCAALVSPPKVNEHIMDAIQANIIGTALLSIACFQRNIRLVYISTDYVFSGEQGMYAESDAVLP